MNVSAKPWYPQSDPAQEGDDGKAGATAVTPHEPPYRSPSAVTSLPSRQWQHPHRPHPPHLSIHVRGEDDDIRSRELMHARGASPVARVASSSQPSFSSSTHATHAAPMSVDAGLDDLVDQLTRPIEGPQTEAEHWEQHYQQRQEKILAEESAQPAWNEGSEVSSPAYAPYSSFAVAGGSYSPSAASQHGSVPELDSAAAMGEAFAGHRPYCSPQLLRREQREQERLRLYRAQQMATYQQSFRSAYSGAQEGQRDGEASQVLSPSPLSSSPSGSPKLMVPNTRPPLPRQAWQRRDAQGEAEVKRGTRHTHNPYIPLIRQPSVSDDMSAASEEADTAATTATAAAATTASTNRLALWPSSAALKESHQRTTSSLPASAAEAASPSPSMIPKPKSKQGKKAEAPTSPLEVATATAPSKSTASSYLGAVVGGARTSVFQSAVPASLVPLPRSKRTEDGEGTGGATTKAAGGGADEKRPHTETTSAAAADATSRTPRAILSLTLNKEEHGTSSPFHRGSNSRLSDALTPTATSTSHTAESSEATVMLSGTVTARTRQTATPSCGSSRQSEEGSGAVAPHPQQETTAGLQKKSTARVTPSSKPQQKHGKKSKKNNHDDWILVKGKQKTSTSPQANGAMEGGGSGSTTRHGASQLFHTSMFDLGKRKDAGKAPVGKPPKRDAGVATSAAHTAPVAPPTRVIPEAAVSNRKDTAAAAAQAKRRKAQQREEEAALLAQLGSKAYEERGVERDTDLADSSATTAMSRMTDASVAWNAREKVNTGGGLPLTSKAEEACVCLVNIPIRALRSLGDLLSLSTPSATTTAASSSGGHTTQILSLLQRSLTLGDSANAKAHLLQRAVGLVSEAVVRQTPGLACAVLLEASDSFVDLERSLQCCHRALRIAETAPLPVFEMLARLCITRTLARVIDTSDAKTHLVAAAALALRLEELPALGWIALQLGITLELSGDFPQSLTWYAASCRIAKDTEQPRLLCDVLCCQAIAYYAVGEIHLAASAHAEAVQTLQELPLAWHQRPLQNFVQLKLQAGDMAGALDIHQRELLLAKEQGDAAAVARCLGSIALANKYLGRFDVAATTYLEELAAQHAPDARQAVECLTGAASCFLQGGHVKKARDYALKAVRQASGSYEQCAIAKALLELAEVELHEGEHEVARRHVVEALDAMDRVDASERKQYLVKATLCELEWRCCSTLQRIAVRSEPPRMLEALLISDLCNVPNTTNIHGLLRRRTKAYGTPDSVAETGPAVARLAAAGVLPASYLTEEVVSEKALVELLRDPCMRNRKLVCYSLPWTEESVCMAFVVSLAPVEAGVTGTTAASPLDVVGVPLTLSEEAVCLLTSPSALNAVFDAPMVTRDVPPKQLYGDTPLWPQHYSKIAFGYEQSFLTSSQTAQQAEETPDAVPVALGSNESGPNLLRSDVMYCLRVLYNTFVKPIEAHLGVATTPADVCNGNKADVQPGLTFVADGIFSRIPFHALHSGEGYLTQRYSITTCCSLAVLCMLHQAERKRRQAMSLAEEGGEAVARVVDVAVSAHGEGEVPSISVAATAAASSDTTTLDRIVVDETVASGPADAEQVSSEAPLAPPSRSDVTRDMEALLTEVRLHRKDKAVSNRIYGAVHDLGSAPPGAPLVLELRLPVVPEVREDFCGFFSASDSHLCASHSFEVSHTWDLHKYAAVVCGGCGTYSGLSIHETGIPVYRSLQYAGAARLILPVGSRVPREHGVAVAAVKAAMGRRKFREGAVFSIADAMQAERCRCIDAGMPLQDWAPYALCGLP